MKNKILIIMVIALVVLPCFVSATTVTITAVENANYSDGYIDGLNNTLISDGGATDFLLFLQPTIFGDLGLRDRSFIDFNTSIIPDGSIIQNIKLNLTTNSVDDPSIGIDVYGLTKTANYRISNSQKGTINNECQGIGSSLYLYNTTYGASEGAEKGILLNTNATNNLTSQLSQDFFSVCLKLHDDSASAPNSNWYFNSSNSGNTNAKPTLTVTYTLPSYTYTYLNNSRSNQTIASGYTIWLNGTLYENKTDIINSTQISGSYIDGYVGFEPPSYYKINSTDLELEKEFLYTYRSFVDFNTSVIPSGATINNVVLNLTVSSYSDNTLAVDIYGLNWTANNLANEALYSECGGGAYSTLFVSGSTAWGGLTANQGAGVSLGSNAVLNLTNYLNQKFFSVCLKLSSETNGNYRYFYASEAGGNAKPQLIVNYLSPLNLSLKLYNNGTLINSGYTNYGTISNFTTFSSPGLYNITAIFSGDSNYASSFETWWLNVTGAVADTSKPFFTNVRGNQSSAIINQNINFTTNVQDNVKVDRAWLFDNFNTIANQTIQLLTTGGGRALGGINYYGQTFSFTTGNYYLTNVCFRFRANTGTHNNITISLYATNGTTPVGNKLTNDIIQVAPGGSGFLTYCNNFAKPIQLNKNTVYAVTMGAPDSSATAYSVDSPNSDLYAGGGWVTSANSGGSWAASTNDLWFNFTGSYFGERNETSINVNSANANISYALPLNWASQNLYYGWCANDTSGNLNCTTHTPYLVMPVPDVTPPTGQITAPQNGTNGNGILPIFATASDDSWVDYVSFQYKNSTMASYQNISTCSNILSPYTCLWNTTQYSAGGEGYNIKLVVVDVAGNVNSSTTPMHYFIDRSAPITDALGMRLTYPIGQMSIRNGQILLMQLNTTDGSGAGLNNSYVNLASLTGGTWTPMLLQSGSLNSTGSWVFWNLTATLSSTLTNFLTSVQYQDNDSAYPIQNKYISSFTTTIDNDAPTYSNIGFNPGIPIYNNTDVSFQISASDNLNLSRYIFSNNFTGSWTNVSGNFSQALTEIVGYDAGNLTRGNYSYFWILYDNAGNANQTANQKIQILGPEPRLTITPISPFDLQHINNSLVSFKWSYTGGAIASYCQMYIDNVLNQTINSPLNDTNLTLSSVILPEGQHNWFIDCNNTDNRWYNGQEALFVVDLTNPTITGINVSNGTASYITPNNTFQEKANVTITTNITDNFNAITDIFFKWFVDGVQKMVGAGQNVFNYIFSPRSSVVTMYANDTAGNSVSQTFNVSTKYINPLLAIVYPLNNSNFSIPSIEINYSFVEANPDTCVWSNNSGLNTTISCGTNITGQTWNEGLNTIKIFANDSVGNTNSSEVTFRVDTTPPLINVSAPLNITYKDQYTYSYSLNATALDSGIKTISSYWYSLNGGTNTSFSPNITLAGLIAGANNIKVYANDSLGNTNFTEVNFYLAFTPKINDINVSNASISYDRNASSLIDGLIGWWKLDKNNTNQVDDVAGINNGTVINATYTDNGKIGGGYNFDGIAANNNYISTTSVFNMTNHSYTFVAWVKLGSYPTLNTGGFIDKWASQSGVSTFGARLTVTTSGKLSMDVGNGTGGSNLNSSQVYTWNSVIPLNSWHMVVGSYNLTDLILCMDNSCTNTPFTLGSPIKNYEGNSFYIGKTHHSNPYINGTMDEIRIYNRSLTGSEIYNLYSITDPTFQEYANVTINATITDEDGGSHWYSWLVDGVSRLAGTTANVFNYIFSSKSSMVQVNINDSNNNVVSQTWNISTQYTSPTINFTSPTPINNSLIATKTFSVNFTGSEPNLDKGWVNFNNINSTATCVGTTPYYCNITYSNVADGIYAFRGFSNDTLGNNNATELRTITFDSTAPIYSNNISNPVSPTTYAQGRAYEFDATWTDIHLSKVLLEFNGVNYTISSGTNVFSKIFTDLKAGSYSYYWYANDTFGNFNKTSTQTFVINKAPPIVWTMINGIRANRTIERTTSASLNGVLTYGIGAISLYQNGTLINNGTGTLTNNTQYNSNGLYIINTTYLGNENFSAGNEIWNLSVVDTTPPVITIINPTASTFIVNSTSFNVTLNEPGDSCYYTLNGGGHNLMTKATTTAFGNTTILPDGLYNTIFFCNDTYGNMGSKSVAFAIDTIPPMISLNAPITTAYYNYTTISFNFTAYDSASLDTCKIYGWTGTNWQVQNITTVVTNGTANILTAIIAPNANYIYNVWCNNSLSLFDYSAQGNQSFRIDVNNPDTTTPSFPSGGSYSNSNGNNFTVNVTDNLGIKNVTINVLNNTDNQTINITTISETGNGVLSKIYGFFIDLGDGVYNWFYKVFDWSGNVFTSLINVFTTDTTRPGINLIAPTLPDGTNTSNNYIEVNATLVEVNPVNVSFHLYNLTGLVSESTVNWNDSLYNEWSGLKDGFYYYNITSTDLAGNINVSETRTINISTIKPSSVEFIPPTPNWGAYHETGIPINISVVSANPLDRVVITHNGVSTTFYSTNPVYYSFLAAEGNNYFNATAYDTFGNYNTSETRDIIVDTTPPDITVTSPTTTKYSDDVPIQFSATDNIAVDTLWYFNGQVNKTYTSPMKETLIDAGIYQFIFYANDSSGNVAQQSVSFNYNYCSDTTRNLFSIIIGVLVLLVLSFVLVLFNPGYFGNVSVYKMVIVFLLITISIFFVVAISQVATGLC